MAVAVVAAVVAATTSANAGSGPRWLRPDGKQIRIRSHETRNPVGLKSDGVLLLDQR